MSSSAVPSSKIFLIGFMGTGKTYWGKKWAQYEGLDFYDLDMIIEKQEGKSIADIFEKKGEAYFRQTEKACLRNFLNVERGIIACGGGAACFDDNMQWMNENGITICITASPAYILSRLEAGQHRRPLIKKFNQAELLFFIEQKLKEREPYYSQAKITLQATALEENSLQQLDLKTS